MKDQLLTDIQSPSQKRTQYHIDPYSRRPYNIDGNTGLTQKINLAGDRVASFHNDITGVAKEDRRKQFATMT